MAPELHEIGILNEPDSREPWFGCEAHARGDSLGLTLAAFEQAMDTTPGARQDARGAAGRRPRAGGADTG